MAGDPRAAGALGGTGAAGTPPGQAAVGAPGRPWSRYEDARTAVVRDSLRTVMPALAAQAGRARLDILDAGGGTGGFAVPLAGLGHNVTVIDPSPDSLAAAERRAAEMNVPLSVVQGDVADLVPGMFADADPGAADALMALEQAASAHPAFHDIATQFHIVGYR
jgi:SAM-dependent methyltransferase